MVLFMNFLKKLSKIQEFMKQTTMWDMNIRYQNADATFRINNFLHNKCMNLLFVPEKYHIIILDRDANTFILGQGWEVHFVHN
jgi:hypothetical protein